MKVVCPFCGVGCNLRVCFNGKVKTTAIENPEVNGRRICIKGANFHHLLKSEERLKKPLLKEGGEFVEVSWREAINVVAEKLKELSPKVGFLCSGKILNEEAYLAQKLCRVLGTNNIDTCARLCHAASEAALSRMLGYGAATVCWKDFERAEVILTVGENIRFSHPVLWNRIKDRKDKTVITADAGREIEADVRLNPVPGTDIIWICAVAKTLIERGWIDRNFVESRTVGFRVFERSLSWCTPELVESCGVSLDKVEEVAELIRRRTIFVWGMGLTQHPHGTKSVMALVNLALLTGNVGREGCGLAPLRGQNNVQGVGDCGANPDQLPGHYRVEDETMRKHFESYWGFKINEKAGLTATEMIHAIAREKIRMLYVIGENPVLSEPQSDVVRWMLESLDFLVVQDIFMTETAKLADVVLPAAMIGEKEGTCVNALRKIQYTHKICDPPGSAMEDWRIILEVARKVGCEWNYVKAEDIWNEVRECTPIFKDADYESLKSSFGLSWPVEGGRETERLYEISFNNADGKAKFQEIQKPGFFIRPTPDYPFVLVTCRLYEHFNSGEMSRRIPSLEKLAEKGCVYLNDRDAASLRIGDGQDVIVHTPYGSLKAKARVGMKKMKIREGVILVPIHFFRECNFNRLMGAYPEDPMSKTPPLKTSPANIIPLPSTSCLE